MPPQPKSSADLGSCDVLVRPLLGLASGGPENPRSLSDLRCLVAQVEAGGREAARHEGQRVLLSPLLDCGKCDLCTRGLRDHCRSPGTRRAIGSGGDARLVVPVRHAHPVPDALTSELAALAFELAPALHAAARLRVDRRSYVTILGDSARGLLAAQVLARANAAVRVLGAQARRLLLCEKWGIRHRHIDEPGRRADQDVVIDAIGSASSLDLACGLIRPRGRIALLGRAPAANLTPILRREIDLVGIDSGPLDEALLLLERGEVDGAPLLAPRERDPQRAANASRAADALVVLVGG
ncbi:MAG: alcohol dehydrogenase catalytic domain-containing protein [Phycisphaeraceae bacterium]|nr:alcohol dehydrogenase catalytic domain-containing protein [Phycisphaeraceae bacterium]